MLSCALLRSLVIRKSCLSTPRHLNLNSIRAMATTSIQSPLKIALCQLSVGADKDANIAHAAEAIETASSSAQLIVLPECWNSPYSTASFPKYAETVPSVGGIVNANESPSVSMLCKAAKDKNVWIVGGSVPEREDDKLYNTCVVVNNEGAIVGKHRKVHLFDIDVPGKITFKESDSLSPGNVPTLVDTPWGVMGVGICYDIRFPEYAIMLRERGARMLIYPGAFNTVTGPAHWELLQRARAVDNQLFVATCSPARDTSPTPGYLAWGHSSVISPWGEVLATTDEKESMVFADMHLEKIDEMRQGIPCWSQKRADMYKLQSKI